MAIGVHNVAVFAPNNIHVALATQATGARDARKLACRLTLTLTPHAHGQYPEHNHHYKLRFRDAGTNPLLEWDVKCSYVPLSKHTEPFEFEKI
jgi:hypothetical protein